MTSEDYMCSPAKSWMERYEELADRSYPIIVVEDIVEPFGHSLSSTPYKPHGVDTQSRDERGIRFTSDMSKDGSNLEEAQRSRSPIHGSTYGTIDDVEMTDINDKGRASPYRSRAATIEDIVERYTPNTVAENLDKNTPPPPIGSQMTYSPYRGPIQDEIHTQPYYGPIVSTIRTNYNDPNPASDRGSGKATAIINKVHNKVSDERIDELSTKYRERMSKRINRQTKNHHRSKSDNTASDLDECSRSRSKGFQGDDWRLRKFECAMLQIEKLESQIKCLRMEVNSLATSKKQAEMRVSHSLFSGFE